MKSADQVLAALVVDGGLAADRAIDLGQKRSRKPNPANAAQIRRSEKAHRIPNNAAAYGEKNGRAIQARFEHFSIIGIERSEVFEFLRGAHALDTRAFPASLLNRADCGARLGLEFRV